MSVLPVHAVRRPATHLLMCVYDHRLVRVHPRSLGARSTYAVSETSKRLIVDDQGRVFCNARCFSHYCDLQDRCAGEFV